MKQVFPDIRPRRLGTRGHSRYCYAAMRKATKLTPPSLPDLSIRSDFLKSTDSDDASWNMIKNWSENMLGTQFETIDDLAKHISQNNLTSASTSKQILQKKLAQRELKDRKRNNVIKFIY
jgi:RFX DNA-binding domain